MISKYFKFLEIKVMSRYVVLTPELVEDVHGLMAILLKTRYKRSVETGMIGFGGGEVLLVPRLLSHEEEDRIGEVWKNARSRMEIVTCNPNYRDMRFVGGLLREKEFSFYIPRVFVANNPITLKITLEPSRSPEALFSPVEVFEKLRETTRKLEETQEMIRFQMSYIEESRRRIRRDSDMAEMRARYKTDESLGKINKVSGNLDEALKHFKASLHGRKKFGEQFGPERADTGHLRAVQWVRKEIDSLEREISKRETFRPPTPVRMKRPSLDISGIRSPSPARMKRPSLDISGIRSPLPKSRRRDSPMPGRGFVPVSPETDVEITEQLRAIREDCGF
jgi:hypothetical protein